jgi:membrane protein implicated in regulation of membrane protease activity
MGRFLDFWRQKTRVSQVLFILAMMYCVSSINVLLLALGVIRWIPQAYLNPKVLIAFSLISFAFALVLSAYHFSTFINRRKRRDDRMRDDRIDVPQIDSVNGKTV